MRSIEVGLRFLVKMGVNQVFGIPAGSINALYDAMVDIPELKSVIVKHETAAGYMAASYTRITGVPSICVGSSGPGATNLVTAAANAWVEKLPIIFITGSVPSTKMGKGGAQELDAVPIFASITKLSKSILDPKQLPEAISEAYHTAISGVPGPVHLSIPINVQMEDIGNVPLPKPKDLDLRPYVDDLSIRRVAQLVGETGSKGVLLLGYGAKTARSSIIRFAEHAGWFVATTPRGKGAFPEDHPLSLGVYGLSGNTKAIEYLNGNEHKSIMVIGSSLGELSSSNWDPRLVKGKKFIHIDMDSTEFGKNYIPDIAVCGDAEIIVERILNNISSLEFPDNLLKSVHANRKEESIELLDNGPEQDWNTKNAIRQIGAIAPADARFYLDIGELMTYSIQNLRIVKDQQFDIDINFGAMGSGIGGSIGAKLAEPERPVICITGDGSFFMHGLEVLTAKQYHIPLLFFVINNARLGMVYHGHMLQYKRCHNDFSQERVDIQSVVTSLGIRSVQVNSLNDLGAEQMQTWLSYNEPMVIEIVVEGNEVPPMGERVKFLEGATY
jgi:acetolactate synthase I/II/III large subunit